MAEQVTLAHVVSASHDGLQVFVAAPNPSGETTASLNAPSETFPAATVNTGVPAAAEMSMPLSNDEPPRGFPIGGSPKNARTGCCLLKGSSGQL